MLSWLHSLRRLTSPSTPTRPAAARVTAGVRRHNARQGSGMSDGINRQDSRTKNLFKGRRPPLRWNEGSEGEILRYLRDLASRLGKETVTTRDVKKDGRVSPATIHRRFGGFSDALIRAGLRPLRTYKRNRTVMLQQLKGLMTELDRVPSKTEVGKNLSYSVRHFEAEFESLKKACELARSI